mgnify:CR=1 FL=1
MANLVYSLSMFPNETKNLNIFMMEMSDVIRKSPIVFKDKPSEKLQICTVMKEITKLIWEMIIELKKIKSS